MTSTMRSSVSGGDSRASMTQTISSAELERIKRSTLTVVPTNDRELKRQHLKKLSQDRLKHWPNTLEALRTKKENFLKEREVEEENKRKEIDREEAELRRSQRLAAIERANKALYEQTDKMKILRSQQQMCDVIVERSKQTEEKKVVAMREKEERQKYHIFLMDKVAKMEQVELEKIEMQKEKMRQIKISRKEQVDEVMKKRSQEIDENDAVGVAMRKRAEEQVLEDIRAQEQKQIVAKEATAQIFEINAKLKVLREELKEQERIDDERRDAEVKKIDELKKARKALEIRRFEKAQVQRQKIIDAAVELLSKKTSNEAALLTKQENELRDKQDREEADKIAKKEREWNETIASRTAQVQAKLEQKRLDAELEDKLSKAWREKAEIAHQKELDKQQKAKDSLMQIKAIQLAEGIKKQRQKVEDRIIKIEQERLLREVAAQDDAKFTVLVNAEIKKNAATGMPVYPIIKALDYREPELLPAIRVPQAGAGGKAPA